MSGVPPSTPAEAFQLCAIVEAAHDGNPWALCVDQHGHGLWLHSRTVEDMGEVPSFPHLSSIADHRSHRHYGMPTAVHAPAGGPMGRVLREVAAELGRPTPGQHLH